mmetsp:Transcript_20645/g.29567  ORF Transcript_20645/g.29567 Transcript_20645/m.29567 type:complete len:238 (-) Transcript_20645:79-792(-)
MVKYSVILPTYQESQNLPLIISLIHTAFEDSKLEYEVIIVDDMSPDGTHLVAERLQKVYKAMNMIIISRPGKLGLGSAYMTGLKQCSGDFVFLMDADMSHHPKYFPDFIKKQKEKNYDIVTATRYSLGGGIAGWDLRRILTSRGANLLANLMLNPGLSDLTGSYRMYKKSVLVDLMTSVKSTAYVFQMEVIIRAKHKGYSIAEVPIVFVDRLYGESKLGASEIVSYLKGLWALFLDT